MPAKPDVIKTVVHFVSKYSGVKETAITNGMVLADPPLKYEDISYNALTLSLRGYIQYSKPDNTILLKDVKKPSQTVGGLINLVDSKV